MDFLSTLLCLSCLFASVILLLTVRTPPRKRPGRLPPGPLPWPVVGNLFQLGKKPHESLAALAAVHGPLMTLKLGQRTTVVVSSEAMAKEVLQRHDAAFSGQTFPDAIRALGHNEKSMIWIPANPLWRTYRRVCSANLFTNRQLDATADLRRRKVAELVAFVEHCGRVRASVNIQQAALVTSLNLMSNTFFSMDLASLGSDGAQEFHGLISGMIQEFGGANIVDHFPALRILDPQGRRRRLETHMLKLFKIFDEIISQRLISKTKSTGKDDVLDALLKITEENSVEGIERSHIKSLLMDLFLAATDSTSITIEWAMAELLRNPSIMTKAREEMKQTIGKGKPIEELDVAQLPYLQAIIKETFRLHPPGPLLLPHRAEEDVEICGYTVPKHTQIIVNAWTIGRDPNTWVKPNEFWPDRFLGLDIDVKGRNFELIPFGAGRRICPGMPQALRIIHLMLGSLIQSTNWKLEEEMTPEGLDMEDVFHLVLQKVKPLRAIPLPI